MSVHSDGNTGFPDIPGYRIESVLGRGSMATVYKAFQRAMNRHVAVKVLHPEITRDKKITRRLMREARIAARLNHPHIVRAHDAGEHEDSCYFVMELIDGASIRELLDRRGPFDEASAVRVAIEIAQALNHFVLEGVIHRDIKPANIIIDQEGSALLADLGLAKLEFDSAMTSKNRSVGTPAYMAPEQARDPDAVDVRSDIFSLGATLYHMVTGVSPFDGPSVGAVLTKILYEEASPIRELDPELSPRLELVIECMLAKDPEDRYESPSLLLRDLRAIARGADLPAVTRTATPVHRQRRFWMAASLILLSVTVLVFIVAGDDGDSNSDEGEVRIPRDERGARPAGELDIATLYELVVDSGADESGASKNPDFEELQSRIPPLLERLVAPLVSLANSGKPLEALRRLDDDLPRLFANALGVQPLTMSPWARTALNEARSAMQSRIRGIDDARQDDILSRARGVMAGAEARLAASEPYLDDEALQREFAMLPIPGRDELDEKHLGRLEGLIENAAREVVAVWKEEFDTLLDEIRRHRDAHRYATSHRLIEAERKRQPGQMGASFKDRLDGAETHLANGQKNLERAIVNAISGVDRFGDRGHGELAMREFDPLISALRKTTAEIPLDRGELTESIHEIELLDALLATLVELESWPEKTASILIEKEGGAPVDLVMRDGKRYESARITSVYGEKFAAELRPGLPSIELSLLELSVETIAGLIPIEDPVFAGRCAVFLLYCDGRPLEAERHLGDLDADHSVTKFLRTRVDAAFAHLYRVRSPEGKEAFTAWRAALEATRSEQWQDANQKLRRLMADPRLNQTAWYKEHRKDIRRSLTEAKTQLDVSTRLGRRAGKYRLEDPDGPIISGLYDFSRPEEARDFQIPRDCAVKDRHFARLMPTPPGRVAPGDVPPLRLPLPVDISKHPFELEFSYFTSNKPSERPRCLTVSLFGHHVSILSRLVRKRQLMHLPLHGVESKLYDFVDFGRIAAWSGPIDLPTKAFLPLAEKPILILEPETRYDIRVTLDPVSRSLALMVNGKERFVQRGITPKRLDEFISIRASMPHRIDDLRFRGALAQP